MKARLRADLHIHTNEAEPFIAYNARDVIARSLSVRETESLVKKIVEAKAPPKPPVPDVHTRAAEDRLRLLLGTRVRIVRRGTRGRIEIEFGSEDELIRIYEQMTDKG